MKRIIDIAISSFFLIILFPLLLLLSLLWVIVGITFKRINVDVNISSSKSFINSFMLLSLS